jgi:transposase-like protein
MPHSADYLKSHGQQAMTAGITCEACHSAKNKANPTAAHASATFCNACHDQYQHQAGWVAGHGDKVDATCATCHTLVGQQGQHNACSTCHNSPDGKWHPDLFYVSHANVVQKQGRESCDTCHNEVQPKCSQCHRNY